MRGRLFVDGLDAYTTWGVYVTEGGWGELIAYPPLKTVKSNDWQEEDGLEVDLSAPVLGSAEPSIRFAFAGRFSRFHDFINHLASRSYHEFRCASIGRTYTLRMLQVPNFAQLRDLGTASVKFSNDFPLHGYTYQPPQSSIFTVADYLLDGRPLSDYGCFLKQGTFAELMKPPAVKTNQVRNISTASGAIYNDTAVTFASKEVRLNCLMRADSLTQLWRNYDALLYDLTRPAERQLEVESAAHTYLCHYKRANVSAFYHTGKIWLEFQIALVITGNLRPSDDCLLSTEKGEFITTEDTANAIDLATTITIA